MRINCVASLWLSASLVVTAVGLALWLQPARAQTPDPLADPVAKGAWLYAGTASAVMATMPRPAWPRTSLPKN